MGQVLSFIRPDRRGPARPPQSEAVANLLLALEAAPLASLRAAVSRRLGGGCFIVACVGAQVFEIEPDDARLASHALFAEQAYVGATEASFQLMELADLADGMIAQAAV